MKELYAKVSMEDWQESGGPLELSCQEVGLALKRDEVKEGFFTVTGEPGQVTEGYVSCDEERMECLTSFFSGTRENIEYRFDSRGMREGEERKGRFLIVSNRGEYEIPFHVVVLHKVLESSEGELMNLFQFTNLARNNWEEAVKLFYSPDFIRVFNGQDKKYRNLYKGFSQIPGNMQNVEEFLVSIHKKQPVEYMLPRTEIVITSLHGQLCETLQVVKNGWGYSRLQVEVEGDFISTEKKILRDEDFLGNQCGLPVFVKQEALHEGKNFGRIILSHAYGQMQASVTVIKRGEHRVVRTGRRLEMKRLTVELVRLYQTYKMKKINMKLWKAQTGEVVERMKRLDDKNPAILLFQAHLRITEESFDEAGRILEHLDIMPDENMPELYCYYLYLSSLYQRSESYTAEVTIQVEDYHRTFRDNWRIAWLLLYLSPTLGRSVSQKWLFLEDQFRHSGTSPVLYLEALHLANFSPTLLMKLDTYELQLLHFGARNGILSEDLIGHMVYLAGKEKYYRESLFGILKDCYQQKSDPQLLTAICSLLIKGNKSGPEYYQWYRRGVEQELRVTRLYEYYMMSVDTEKEVEIPRIVLMYFAYQSNLDYDKCAYLYAYIQKHREEFPELYLAYKSQMDRFVLQQLYKGRINRQLAFLYQTVLDEKMLTRDNCQALAPLLFIQQLDCEGKDIRKAVVIHTRLRGEQVYPVENGRAYVAVFDRDYEILLEDEEKNRYAAGRPFVLDRLMYPARCVNALEPLVEKSLGFNLFFCESSKGKIRVTKENASRFRELAEDSRIIPAFARAIRIELLRYYYGHEELEELDLLLEALKREDLDGSDVYEAIGFLVLRSFYEKAFAWLAGLAPERTDAKILLRLCSRMLETGLGMQEEEMTRLAYSAFCREKYDSRVLQHLVEHYEGSTRELTDIRLAAENFAVDTYVLTERLLVQLLYIGDNVMGRIGLLRKYIIGGGKSELESAFLHRCSGLYLMNAEPMDRYVITDIGRVAGRGETLSDMCRLAYLEYFARHRDERSPRTDALIKCFGDQLIRNNMKLPLFQEYVDILEGAETMMDKTMVVFRGNRERPVTINYRIVPSPADGGELTAAQGTYRSFDLQHMYAGIYTASFVLFAGESLQYFITDNSGGGEILDSGELKMGECSVFVKESRYGMINDIASARLMMEEGEAQELLEQYLLTEWMTEGLFKAME